MGARRLQAPLAKPSTPPVAFLLHFPCPERTLTIVLGDLPKSRPCPGGLSRVKMKVKEKEWSGTGGGGLEQLGEWEEPPASGGRQGGACGEDLGGERGRASLGWRAGHAGAWGRGENPTRELLESPVAASHFTGEGAGREPIKSECAAAAGGGGVGANDPGVVRPGGGAGRRFASSLLPAPFSGSLSSFLPLVPDPGSVRPLRPLNPPPPHHTLLPPQSST